MFLRLDPIQDLDRLTQQLRWSHGRSSIMPMDAYRDRDRIVVCVDLPGVEPDSLDVTLDHNVLSVAAARYWQPLPTHQVLAAERPTGRFQRQIHLGDGWDPDKVEARYESGVLTVTIPIADAAKPRKIEVGSASHTKAIEAPVA